MSKNVFEQIAEAHRSRQQAGKVRSEQEETEFILSLRNDNTNADEAVIYIKAIMYVLTAFVIYLGFNYYLNTFNEMFPPAVAFLFALALPTVVEVGKIRLLSKGLRSISLGWAWSSFANLGYWSLVLALGIGSFWWSYTISTGGIKEVARQSAIENNKQDSLHVLITAACADIDQRIADLKASNEQAGSMKTRRGKIAWSGQTIQMNNSATLLALQQERQQRVDQVTADYKAQASETKTKVGAWAGFIERFGGWGEWGVLICLIAVAFFERRLYDQNKDALKKANPAVLYPNGQSGPTTTATNAKAPYNSTIGFYWANYGRTDPAPNLRQPHPLFPPEENTVTQPAQTVSQPNPEQTVFDSDAVLLNAKTAIQRDLPNFKRTDARPETVAGRIHDILNRLANTVRRPGFAPSHRVAAEFYAFAQESVFPALREKGYGYEYEKPLAAHLYKMIPQPAAAT